MSIQINSFAFFYLSSTSSIVCLVFWSPFIFIFSKLYSVQAHSMFYIHFAIDQHCLLRYMYFILYIFFVDVFCSFSWRMFCIEIALIASESENSLPLVSCLVQQCGIIHSSLPIGFIKYCTRRFFILETYKTFKLYQEVALVHITYIVI